MKSYAYESRRGKFDCRTIVLVCSWKSENLRRFEVDAGFRTDAVAHSTLEELADKNQSARYQRIFNSFKKIYLGRQFEGGAEIDQGLLS
ncbi:hypothetical protein D3C81_1573340 [compost metagenome]